LTASPKPEAQGGQAGIPDRGVLAIDKESGPTSHDVVAVLRRLLGVRRVGHCGTLDPLATGVLIVCFGRYTRLADWIAAGEKEYAATFHLGVDSETGDGEGPLLPREVDEPPGPGRVREALGAFTGPIDQVPPAHSAVKVSGVASYRLARRDRAVELKPRRVHIHRLDLVRYAYPLLEVNVVCSKGTYIRSLAADLGRDLGCGAYVDQLRRRRVGEVGLDSAHTVAAIGDSVAGGAGRLLIPPDRALSHLESVHLDGEAGRLFAHGGCVPAAAGKAQSPCAVYGPHGRLLGIARRGDDGSALVSQCVVGDADG